MEEKISGFLLGFIIIISLPFCVSHAHDPGIPDTVRFEQWGTCVPCPPCSGVAIAPLAVFNDEELINMDIPLRLTGPVAFDSGRFVGEITRFLENPGTYGYFKKGDLQGKTLLVVIASAYSDSVVPPMQETIAHLFFTVSDTGLASIDETDLVPDISLNFLSSEWEDIVPIFLRSEFYIGPQDVLPGDIDANDVINLSDAISLARYILMEGPLPMFSGSADVNTDCNIDLSDVILIALWYFYAQVTLQPGCAY